MLKAVEIKPPLYPEFFEKAFFVSPVLLLQEYKIALFYFSPNFRKEGSKAKTSSFVKL